MPDRVAQHVFARAAQQLSIARQDRTLIDSQDQPASLRFRLDGTIGHQVFEQFAEFDFLGVSGRGITLGPRELQQLVNQLIEPIAFLSYPRECRLAVIAGFRQLDREAQPRQGRAKLVGNVLEQPAFGREQGRDVVGHPVKGPRQLADLVLPGQMEPNPQLTASKTLDHPAQVAQRRGKVNGQQVTEHADQEGQPEEILKRVPGSRARVAGETR